MVPSRFAANVSPVPKSSKQVLKELPVDRPKPRYDWRVVRAIMGKSKEWRDVYDAREKQLRVEWGRALSRVEAAMWAQAEVEVSMEGVGLLNDGVAGGYGIRGDVKRADDPGVVLSESVTLEKERSLYVDLAREVHRLGRRCTARQAVEWSMDNGMLPVGEIYPEAVPGPGAVSMLWFFRVMPEKVMDSWRSLLTKADMEDRQRFDDTGENVIGMLAPLSEGLVGSTEEG